MVDLSRIRTWIVGREGEHADHLTTTTAQATFLTKVALTPCDFWVLMRKVTKNCSGY